MSKFDETKSRELIVRASASLPELVHRTNIVPRFVDRYIMTMHHAVIQPCERRDIKELILGLLRMGIEKTQIYRDYGDHGTIFCDLFDMSRLAYTPYIKDYYSNIIDCCSEVHENTVISSVPEDLRMLFREALSSLATSLDAYDLTAPQLMELITSTMRLGISNKYDKFQIGTLWLSEYEMGELVHHDTLQMVVAKVGEEVVCQLFHHPLSGVECLACHSGKKVKFKEDFPITFTLLTHVLDDSELTSNCSVTYRILMIVEDD